MEEVKNQNKICVIITNYNGYEFLQKYLLNIQLACAENEITLIVSDNGSTDSSISYLQQHKIIYTINKTHGPGFAGNVNNGIEFSSTIDEFDHFVIASNDVEIHKQFFFYLNQVLVDLEVADPKYGLLGFEEVTIDKKEYFYEFDYSIENIKINKRVNEIQGFLFAIKKEVVEQVGLLDEEYFMYGEDNDYFYRIRKAGYTIYLSQLPALHYSEGSSANPKKTSWLVYRNAFLFAQKNLGFLGFLKMLFAFIYLIYNPFDKRNDPSALRIKRCGFLYNNYLLCKSLIWNGRYFINKSLC